LLREVEQGCLLIAAPHVVDKMLNNIPKPAVVLLYKTSKRLRRSEEMFLNLVYSVDSLSNGAMCVDDVGDSARRDVRPIGRDVKAYIQVSKVYCQAVVEMHGCARPYFWWFLGWPDDRCSRMSGDPRAEPMEWCTYIAHANPAWERHFWFTGLERLQPHPKCLQ
jgi:hypothetical protein